MKAHLLIGTGNFTCVLKLFPEGKKGHIINTKTFKKGSPISMQIQGAFVLRVVVCFRAVFRLFSSPLACLLDFWQMGIHFRLAKLR